ncbi:unnamed protein product [Closterium sp. Naga37s-1]|nr:unnamed protein product [Closterium sp. Naga37s-1]
MGVEDYEPRVVHQLLEFAYRYMTDVLGEARVYAEHAGHATLEVDDVRLAVQAKVSTSFSQPPPREMLMELARARNAVPIPPIAGSGLFALPPEAECLLQPNVQIAVPLPGPAARGSHKRQREGDTGGKAGGRGGGGKGGDAAARVKKEQGGAELQDGKAGVGGAKPTVPLPAKALTFEFNHVFGYDSSNFEVYTEFCKGAVERAVAGCRAVVLVYGQTGTGKTHTISGSNVEAGVFHHAMADVFRAAPNADVSRYNASCSTADVSAAEREVVGALDLSTLAAADTSASAGNATSSFPGEEGSSTANQSPPLMCFLSVVEIYNERAVDLLQGVKPSSVQSKENGNSRSDSSDNSLSRTAGRKLITEQQLHSVEEAAVAFELAGHRRKKQYQQTRGQAQTQQQQQQQHKEQQGKNTRRQQQQVGGSRRVGQREARRRETESINKSLLALTSVLTHLSQARPGLPPYRRSLLTRLLQPCLGGRSGSGSGGSSGYCAVLFCIDPQDVHVSKTTLRYSAMTRQIRMDYHPSILSLSAPKHAPPAVHKPPRRRPAKAPAADARSHRPTPAQGEKQKKGLRTGANRLGEVERRRVDPKEGADGKGKEGEVDEEEDEQGEKLVVKEEVRVVVEESEEKGLEERSKEGGGLWGEEGGGAAEMLLTAGGAVETLLAAGMDVSSESGSSCDGAPGGGSASAVEDPPAAGNVLQRNGRMNEAVGVVCEEESAGEAVLEWYNGYGDYSDKENAYNEFALTAQAHQEQMGLGLSAAATGAAAAAAAAAFYPSSLGASSSNGSIGDSGSLSPDNSSCSPDSGSGNVSPNPSSPNPSSPNPSSPKCCSPNSCSPNTSCSDPLTPIAPMATPTHTPTTMSTFSFSSTCSCIALDVQSRGDGDEEREAEEGQGAFGEAGICLKQVKKGEKWKKMDLGRHQVLEGEEIVKGNVGGRKKLKERAVVLQRWLAMACVCFSSQDGGAVW